MKIQRRKENITPIGCTIGRVRAKHTIQIGINRTAETIMAPHVFFSLRNDRMFINVSAVNRSTAFGSICGSASPHPLLCDPRSPSSRLSAIIPATNGNNNINGWRCNGIADINFDADNRKTVPGTIMAIILLNHLLYGTFNALDARREKFTANFHY